MSDRELFETGTVRKKKAFVHGSHNLNGKVEWYTPVVYVDSARNVMRGIDLDPCTSELAQRIIQARRFYTIDTNGRNHAWSGNVWLNPPYASAIITAFVDKLLGHLATGEAP